MVVLFARAIAAEPQGVCDVPNQHSELNPDAAFPAGTDVPQDDLLVHRKSSNPYRQSSVQIIAKSQGSI